MFCRNRFVRDGRVAGRWKRIIRLGSDWRGSGRIFLVHWLSQIRPDQRLRRIHRLQRGLEGLQRQSDNLYFQTLLAALLPMNNF